MLKISSRCPQRLIKFSWCRTVSEWPGEIADMSLRFIECSSELEADNNRWKLFSFPTLKLSKNLSMNISVDSHRIWWAELRDTVIWFHSNSVRWMEKRKKIRLRTSNVENNFHDETISFSVDSELFHFQVANSSLREFCYSVNRAWKAVAILEMLQKVSYQNCHFFLYSKKFIATLKSIPEVQFTKWQLISTLSIESKQ